MDIMHFRGSHTAAPLCALWPSRAGRGVLAIITAVVLWGVISMLLLMEAKLMRRTLFAVSGAAIFAITAWI